MRTCLNVRQEYRNKGKGEMDTELAFKIVNESLSKLAEGLDIVVEVTQEGVQISSEYVTGPVASNLYEAHVFYLDKCRFMIATETNLENAEIRYEKSGLKR